MSISLNAELREGRKANVLRAQSKLTAEIYGPDVKNQDLVLDYNEFVKVYDEAGESSVVDVVIGGKKYPVLINEVQTHPVSNRYINVDLRQVSMTEKLETDIELKFIGEAPAAKTGGVFIANKSKLSVKALPADLVGEIEVDISGLAAFEDKILIKDVKLPKGIEVLDNPEDMVASIGKQIEEEKPAVTAEEEKAAIESLEVEKKGKEETEEGAEEKAPAEKKEKEKK